MADQKKRDPLAPKPSGYKFEPIPDGINPLVGYDKAARMVGGAVESALTAIRNPAANPGGWDAPFMPGDGPATRDNTPRMARRAQAPNVGPPAIAENVGPPALAPNMGPYVMQQQTGPSPLPPGVTDISDTIAQMAGTSVKDGPRIYKSDTTVKEKADKNGVKKMYPVTVYSDNEFDGLLQQDGVSPDPAAQAARHEALVQGMKRRQAEEAAAARAQQLAPRNFDDVIKAGEFELAQNKDARLNARDARTETLHGYTVTERQREADEKHPATAIFNQKVKAFADVPTSQLREMYGVDDPEGAALLETLATALASTSYDPTNPTLHRAELLARSLLSQNTNRHLMGADPGTVFTRKGKVTDPFGVPLDQYELDSLLGSDTVLGPVDQYGNRRQVYSDAYPSKLLEIVGLANAREANRKRGAK